MVEVLDLFFLGLEFHFEAFFLCSHKVLFFEVHLNLLMHPFALFAEGVIVFLKFPDTLFEAKNIRLNVVTNRMSELVEIELLLLKTAGSGRPQFLRVGVGEVLSSGDFFSVDV